MRKKCPSLNVPLSEGAQQEVWNRLKSMLGHMMSQWERKQLTNARMSEEVNKAPLRLNLLSTNLILAPLPPDLPFILGLREAKAASVNSPLLTSLLKCHTGLGSLQKNKNFSIGLMENVSV